MEYLITEVSKDSLETNEILKLLHSEYGKNDDRNGELDKDNLYKILALKQNKTVIGGAILHLCETEFNLSLSYIIIAEKWRSNGLGKLLIEYCKKLLEEIRHEYGEEGPDFMLNLVLYAERWNKRSQNFYDKNGFEKIQEEEDIYENGYNADRGAFLYVLVNEN